MTKPGAVEPRTPRHRWVIHAAVCLGLLLLPLLVWLLFPAQKPIYRTITVAPPKAASVERKSEAAPRVSTPSVVPTRASAEPVQIDATEVSGVVLDPDGRPVEQAFVACREAGAIAAATGTDGRFSLSLSADGCEAVATHDSFGASDPKRLVRGSGNTLRLTRGGRIGGIVVDESGQPVTSYVIAVESFVPRAGTEARGMVGRMSEVESESGSFLLDGLLGGSFVLSASSRDGRPPTRSARIDLESGAFVRDVRLVLARGGTLIGRVTDTDTREAIAGAIVAFDLSSLAGASGAPSATTDPNGNFRLVGCPSGAYSVRVTHPDFKSKVMSGPSIGGGQTARQDIALRRGEGRTGEIETDGIGAFLLTTPEGKVQVMAVLKGSPAERAGLRQLDVITRIDGVATEGMTMVEATQRIRGVPGTSVALDLAREGRPLDLVIGRETVAR